MKIETLKSLLENINNYSDDVEVYLSKGVIWNVDTKIILLNEDDKNCDNKLVLNYEEYYYVFGLYVVNDVIENLKLQKKCKNINLNEFINALKYYYENDAFIEC